MATTPKALFFPPKSVPGQGMTKVTKQQVLIVKSQRLMDTNLVVGANEIFSVPANTLVKEVALNIVSAFNGSVTLTIGDGTDADGFLDDIQIAPTVTGWKSSLADANPFSLQGKLYASADTVDITRGGGTPTAGSADAFLFYIPNFTEVD